MTTAAAPQKTVNLWILDDDEEMCALLSRQCQQVGWLLRAFHHPRQLSQALESDQPDLLILDQLLPEKHGLEVLNRLSQGGKTFPVLILSALGAPSDRVAGLEAGAGDYLPKPFLFRELQLRIDRLLLSSPAAAAPEPSPWLQNGCFELGSLRFEAGLQHALLTPDGERHRLSRGDSALLLAFCGNPGVVISRSHLLRATGSLVTPGQSRTIDVRLSRLRRLLRQLAGSDLIVPQRGQGYKLMVEVKKLADEPSVLTEV
jgi:two-component system phosphate regulon response regulator OmpR